MVNSENALSNPVPSFSLEDGEVKQVTFVFAKEDSAVEIGILSEGFGDDINEITVALAFVLEKLTN